MRRGSIFALGLLAAVLAGQELSLSLPLMGVGPDLLIMVAVGFAIGERPGTAATYGFIAGLLRDLLLTGPRGLSAFAYAVACYLIGLAGEVRGVWVLIGTVAGATFVSQTIIGVGARLLSSSGRAGSVPRVALATTLWAVILAPLVLPAIRRIVATERRVGGEVASRP